MSAPTRYVLTYDFTGFQSANPNTPLPADKLEIEFNNLDKTTGEIITNLGLIQRDDGKLKNKIVGVDALDDATKVLLGTPINPRGDWAANTAYKVLDLVTVGETTYIAVVDHASGTSFTVDLTADKWQLWANPGFVEGTSFFQKFSGNGSQTVFTMSQDMGTDENGLMIFINNSGWIPQDPANFTINGVTLTFLAAPPNGTNNVFAFAPSKLLSQAAAYAAAASTSATSAASSASAASTSETNAASSATTAGTAATNAASSATTAGTAATNAASSASAASTSETNAASSASAASTSETNAASSASAASTSATSAAGSATTASSAATTATTAASNASVSATSAAASAASAAAQSADVVYFKPANKYSPYRLTEKDGWANGQPDDGTPAVHDASAGGAPSFTTAKCGQIAIVTGGGSFGTNTVVAGDILVAQRNNPTLTSHWAIVSDCTTEFNAAIAAAQGGEVWLRGTYMLTAADPDAKIKLRGEFTILNKCGYTAINTLSNQTYAIANSTLSQVSSVTQSVGLDPITGASMNRVTTLQLTTAAEYVNFKQGQQIQVVCDTATPSTAASSSKVRVASHARIQKVQSDGKIFLDSRVRWHNTLAAASTVYVIGLNTDRAADIEGMFMQGAPTILGESVGWWKTLFGTEVSGTITGSGSSRTITRNDHKHLVNEYIRVGGTSGATDTSCKITAVTTNTITISIPTYKDLEVAGSPVASGVPTSGTIYYQPVFNCSEFDNTTHGAHTILLHASGSRVIAKSARQWGKGISFKKSHFCYLELEGMGPHAINPLTSMDRNITSGRLLYAAENWQGARNRMFLRGIFPRHDYTSNHTSTTTSFTGTLTWLLTNTGCCVDNYLDSTAINSTSLPDSHDDENGLVVIGDSHFPVMNPFAESYFAGTHNNRGMNEKRIERQRGGVEGLVLRAVEREAGSIERLDLDVEDIPYNSTSNMGFRTESHASITNKPTVVGQMKFKNCGIGSQWQSGVTGRLDLYRHVDVAKYGIYLLGTTDFSSTEVILGYTTNTEGQSTRNAVVMSGTAKIRFGVMSVTLGAANNPAEIFTDIDNTSGKIVQGGILIVNDPNSVGMPLMNTSGRDANFTINIGKVIYNGTDITANYAFATGGAAADIQVFTSSGTWTKPLGKTVTQVMMIAGGASGGGAGASNGTNSIAGAGGGQSGARSVDLFSTAMLGATETVTVGTGGATKAGTTTTSGATGNNGGDSSFGSWLRAKGGAAGSGTGAGGSAAQYGTTAGNNGASGSAGAVGANATPDGSVFGTGLTGGGGGGGGGVAAADASSFQGGTGGRKSSAVGTTGAGTAGTSSGGNGGNGGNDTTNRASGGGGGGGGGGNHAGNGGNGGAGGSYGGGGGGGGAASNGNTGGSGGAGGNGILVAISW